MIDSTPVDNGWTLSAGPRRIDPGTPKEALDGVPASVPGSVHTDLFAAGIIGDPLHGVNEQLQAWIGTTDWTYRTKIPQLPLGYDRHDLVFDGIDTVSEVVINGVTRLRTRNQHRSYRISVDDSESGGDLEVRLAAPVPAADAAAVALRPRPHVNAHPFNAIRKMASSFGWDWGPVTASSGLWKPVRLESWSSARFGTVTVQPELLGGNGLLRLTAEVVAAEQAGEMLTVRAVIAGQHLELRVVGGVLSDTVVIPQVRKWWPAGHGAADLYDLDLVLVAEDGTELDRWQRRIGFRTVETRSIDDEHGSSFELFVNDEPVFVRGVNWIPDDPFPHRVDRDRYHRRLDQAMDANVNLVRVWGGGVFESEHLYDYADEHGLLVWQDALLACAAYSEAPSMREEIEGETREALQRLGSHAAFVLFNGNNENLWKLDQEHWRPQLSGETWGAHYYYDMFPRLIQEIAPHVAYTPGSPFSPDPNADQNAEDSGTFHEWDVWNDIDYTAYRDRRPRFVAEFGWQGPAALSTLKAALDDDPLTPESPGMIAHQKAINGAARLALGLVPHLRTPLEFEDWHLAMSINQAHAIRTSVGWYRSLFPRLTGTILWQLNDCWPAISWSIVDSAERRKLAWYVLRDAYAPKLLTLQPDGERVVLHALNDTADQWHDVVRVARRSFSGDVRGEEKIMIDIPPHGSLHHELDHIIATPDVPAAEVITASTTNTRTEHYFCEPRDLLLPIARFAATAERHDSSVAITVTADTFVRDLVVCAETVDSAAEVDRQLVTLLPGETVKVIVRSHAEVPADDFLAAGVIRTLNDLVAANRPTSA